MTVPALIVGSASIGNLRADSPVTVSRVPDGLLEREDFPILKQTQTEEEAAGCL